MIYQQDIGRGLTNDEADFNLDTLRARYKTLTGQDMPVTLRRDLARPLTPREMDTNFQGLDQALMRAEYGDGPYPVFDQVFGANARYLDPRITFSRPGDSYRTVNGVLRKWGPNEPVLTGAGLDTRPAETNLVGADIAGANWAISGGNRLTMGPVVEQAGFSLRKATIAVESVSGSYVTWSPQIPVTPGKVTLTAYLKQDTPGWAFLSFLDDATSKQGYAYYDLATGTVGHKNQSSGWSVIATTMEALSDGVWRLVLVVQTDGTQIRPYLYGQVAGNVNQGSVGLSGNVWYAAVQVNQGDPIPYIPTTDSAVTRPADNASIQGDAFASIWNPMEGAIVLDVTIPRPTISGKDRIVRGLRASNNDEFLMAYRSVFSGDLGIALRDSAGRVLVSKNMPFPDPSDRVRFGIAFHGDTASIHIDGAKEAEASSVDIISGLQDMNRIQFSAPGSSAETPKLLRRLTIFNRRPSDAQM